MAGDALLAAIVNSSNDAIISKNLNSIITSWNPAATRIFGFSAAEMVGQSIRKLIPVELQHEEDMILARVTSGEPVEAFETMRLTSSGERIPVSVTVSPVRDADGRIIGASKIARDLRETWALAAELRLTEQRFQMLADNMSQFAWIAEPAGDIIWYNRRWYDYTGTTLEEMKGWGWQSVHHPDHLDRVADHYRHSLETGSEWEDTFPLRGADGEYRWFLSRAHPVRDEEGHILCWFGTNTDITEERNQREKIRLLMREVSHRSKNMLSMVQALARRTASGDHTEFVRRFEERIQALAAHQDLLIRGNWTGVDMADLVKAQLYYVEDLIGKRIMLSGPRITVMPTPAEAIGMALHELATNASKYGALSNDNGRIEIGWSLDEAEDGTRFSLDWRESGGPPVNAPAREGFGTTVINRIPAISLGAEVGSDFGVSGLHWHLRCAADRVQEELEEAE